MAAPNHDLAVIQEVYGEKALSLATELVRPEAIAAPEPPNFRRAGKYLSLYFEHYLHGLNTQNDANFYHVLDFTTSALLALYHRDTITHRQSVDLPLGAHAADYPLENGLMGLQAVFEDLISAGRTIDQTGYAPHQTAAVVTQVYRAKGSVATPDTSKDQPPLRSAMAGAITNMRYLHSAPDTFDRLAAVGNFAAMSMYGMSDVIARHAGDLAVVGFDPHPISGTPVERKGMAMHHVESIATATSNALHAGFDPAWPPAQPTNGMFS